MRIVLLGGGGLMARVIARDLVEHHPGLELVLGDLDPAAAERVAATLAATDSAAARGVSVAAVDAGDPTAVAALIRGAGACLNAALYYFNVSVMEAALAERVPYLDLGGLFHVTRRQLPLTDPFARAGVTAVIGMGSTPGVTNVQARHAAERLDRVERIAVYCGSSPPVTRLDGWSYSIHTILDEISKPPVVFRDGRLVQLEPLAEPETFRFLDPIGPQEVHHSLHSELATLPDAFAAQGLRDCSFKLNYFGFAAPVALRLRVLAEAGLADTEPLAVRDRSGGGALASVSPRDVLLAVLARRAGDDPAAADFTVDHEEVAVEVRGTRDGRPLNVRIDTLAAGRADWGVPGGTLLTATPPAIVAGWLADGSLRLPGVHAPERAIDPQRLFEALAARDIHTTIEERPSPDS